MKRRPYLSHFQRRTKRPNVTKSTCITDLQGPFGFTLWDVYVEGDYWYTYDPGRTYGRAEDCYPAEEDYELIEARLKEVGGVTHKWIPEWLCGLLFPYFVKWAEEHTFGLMLTYVEPEFTADDRNCYNDSDY